MKNKINNILRFFTLLFTDKDIEGALTQKENEEKNIDSIPTMNDWGIQEDNFFPKSSNNDTNEDILIHIQPTHVGPDKEEIDTKVLVSPPDKILHTLPELNETENLHQ